MSQSGHLQVARDEDPLAVAAPPFVSILFPDGRPSLDAVGEPPSFRDLNLDQVVEAVVAKREEYDLVPFFHTPLASVEQIDYRHEVFRDVDVPAVRDQLREFGERMHRVRSFLTLVRKQHYKPEKQRWLLDAATLYVKAVRDLTSAFRGVELASTGLRSFATYLVEHVSGASFTSLASEAAAVLDGLEQVNYALQINGSRVTVTHYEDEPDYSDEIEELFARFRQGDVESKLAKVADGGSMDHVEAKIAQLVARLFPREFEALDRFCASHSEFIEATIATFDRGDPVLSRLGRLSRARLRDGPGLLLPAGLVGVEAGSRRGRLRCRPRLEAPRRTRSDRVQQLPA